MVWKDNITQEDKQHGWKQGRIETDGGKQEGREQEGKLRWCGRVRAKEKSVLDR